MTAASIAGFVVLGLSPSFVDWEENPNRRPQILLYYGIAIGLILYGSRRGE
jgi:hypothetical protein